MRQFLLALTILLSANIYADVYFIGFTDKQHNAASLTDAATLLSERALQRRSKAGIALDSTDLPVSQMYLDSIVKLGCQVRYSCRWTNGAVADIADDNIVEELKKISFIDTIQLTKHSLQSASLISQRKMQVSTTDDIPTLADSLRIGHRMHNLDKLHELGYRGKNIQIAVIDNGFANDLNLNLGQFGGSPLANPNVPSIWPTTGVVTSPYGLRWGGTDFHQIGRASCRERV